MFDISKIDLQSADKEKKPEQPVTSPLSKIDEQWLNDHLERIRKLITDEAVRAANFRGADHAEGLDVAMAAKTYAPGDKFRDEPKFFERIGASLSGITLVSALLAVVFGFIGWLRPTDAAYFDIVKLFAGAVVGSTGAGVALTFRQR